ncbi:MAG: GAF domain-containing protein [Anaerolineae bacterium]|nr:GAF domain-containing protein [Anaerolineae bacterium]
MLLRHFNFLNWSIRVKLTVIFLVAILVPILVVMVPAVSQRIDSLRQENQTRLETLGPYEIKQTNQTFNALINELQALISSPTDYSQLEDYLYRAPTAMSEALREPLERSIEIKVVRFLTHSPSLSRIRLVGFTGSPVMDATQKAGMINVVFDPPSPSATPADELILSDEIGVHNTLTSIYPDAEGNPSIDVILTFRSSQQLAGGSAFVIGHVVFTQNLAVTDSSDPLPGLYAALRDFPESTQPTHVFLLNQEGLLLSPARDLGFLTDAHDSRGFKAAQRSEVGVSTYYSPLLDTDVLGYHEAIQLTDGPEITFLVETPVQGIDDAAFEEVILTLLPVAFGGLLLGLGAAFIGTVVIGRPIAQLTEVARQVTGGHLDIDLPELSRQDEIGILHNTFGDMSAQLFHAIEELETRVAERTQDLETTLEIGRILTNIRDLDSLLEEVVTLIRDRFDTIYHAQVFLIDAQTQQAMLRASTGTAGRQLLQRGHYLEVGSRSVIGSVTASGYAVVALDTSANPLHKRNEFLPDTRAEMALPLRLGDRVIGALDLQSKQPDAFGDRDVELFQGMADQITIAIQNAALFDESNARLQEIENLNRLLTRGAWQEEIRGRSAQELSATAGRLESPDGGWTTLQQEAIRTHQIAERVDGDTVTFAVPVMLRDEVLGAVEWQVPAARYTGSVRQTALELTTRLALTADNIRLFEQSQRAARRESLVNQISGKLTATTDIDQILQTAVRELGLALRVPQAAIQLVRPTSRAPESQADTTDG